MTRGDSVFIYVIDKGLRNSRTINHVGFRAPDYDIRGQAGQALRGNNRGKTDGKMIRQISPLGLAASVEMTKG